MLVNRSITTKISRTEKNPDSLCVCFVKQILDLPVKTEKNLTSVMGLVFDKAVTEPGFSTTYAQLCHSIAKVRLSLIFAHFLK